MSKVSLEEHKSYKELLLDYSQETTFHGLRYTTPGGPPGKLRRRIWLVLVLAAFATFLYLFISRLQHFFSHPISVSVSVTYQDKLPFPAVTVCNQNQFRLSKIHEYGLFDLFMEKYAAQDQSEINTPGCKDTFTMVRTGCLNKNHSVEHMKEYREVTLEGCKYLCHTLDSMICGVVLFLPLERSCILQPVIPLDENDEGCRLLEIHRRHRCPATINSFCDYDGSSCSLLQDTKWLKVQANVVNSSQADHTTATVRGNLLYLPESYTTVIAEANLYTEYAQTDGMCVELFYSNRGRDQAKLTISYRGEDFIPRVLSTSVLTRSSWFRMFARLPAGLNQILISGRKEKNSYAGIILDSIGIDRCEEFEKTCMRFIGGAGYTGQNATTPYGSCMSWKYVPQAWHFWFSDHILSLDNQCRTPETPGQELLYGVPSRPWCYISEKTYTECAISYCECRKDYRPCGDGRCLPQSMMCDGNQDCPDAKDEIDYCKDKISVTCQFEDAFMCGYNGTERVSQGAFWSRQSLASSVWETATGGYLAVEIGATDDRIGFLMTPETKSNTPSCLNFYYRVGDAIQLKTDKRNILVVLMTDIKESLTGMELWWSKAESSGRQSVTIPARPNGAFIIFKGIFTRTTEMVGIAQVELKDGACPVTTTPVTCKGSNFSCNYNCVASTKKCDGTVNCYGSIDEQDSTCIPKRNVNCDFIDDFKCGYTSGSSLSDFAWSREIEVAFPLISDSADKTILGYSCAFPFEYDGKSNAKCVTDTLHPGSPWCSLAKVYNENTTHWDYCTGSGSGELFSGTSGIIQHTNYPKTYLNMERARYEVLLPVGMRIKLFIEDLEIEESSNGCAYDYLVIPKEDIDINSVPRRSYPYIMVAATESKVEFSPYPSPGLGKYIKICGKISENDPFWGVKGLYSISNRLRVYFISDGSVQKRGFSMRYESEIKDISGSLDFILAAGIAATDSNKVNPNSQSLLKSPEFTLSQKSCLRFTFSIVSDLEIVVQPKQPGKISQTVWTSNVFSGNTWSYALANLKQTGTFYLLIYHKYGLDVKIKSNKARPLPFSAAISKIQIATGSCEIPVTGTLECSFEDIDQCGYLDHSQDLTHWTRVNRDGRYFMAANIRLSTLNNPAVLLSKSVMVENDTCVGVDYVCYWCKNKDFVITLSTVSGGTVTKLISFPPSINNYQTIRAVHLPKGTYQFNVSALGIGEVYLERIFLMNTTNCSSIDEQKAVPNIKVFEKWNYLAFSSPPSTEEFRQSQFGGDYYENYVQFGDGNFDYGSSSSGSYFGSIFGSSGSWSGSGDSSGSGDLSGSGSGASGSGDPMSGSGSGDNSGSGMEMTTGAPEITTTGSPYASWNDPIKFNNTISSESANNMTVFDYKSDTKHQKPDPYGPMTHTNMSAFHDATGHQLSDLVYSCKWDGRPCNITKVKETISDLGHCITFNSDPDDRYNTSKIGAGFGLSMTLNVEQYEYIKSRNTDSGVKVYLHHQHDLPLVKELGFAIYPGVHALVGAKYSVAESLAPPYGYCGEVPLKFFGSDQKYTRPMCEVECLTSQVINTCDCKMAYMPDVQGLQNPTCIDHCVDSCGMYSFSADLSYAGMSTLSIGSVVQDDRDKLEKKYLLASEISERVNVHSFEDTIKMMNNIPNALESVDTIVHDHMKTTLSNLAKAMIVFTDFFTNDIKALETELAKHTSAFEAKIGNLVKNFKKRVEKVVPVLQYIIDTPTLNIAGGRDEISKSDLPTSDLVMITNYVNLLSAAMNTTTTTTSKRKKISYTPKSFQPPYTTLKCSDAKKVYQNVSAFTNALQNNPQTLEVATVVLLNTINLAKDCYSFYEDALTSAKTFIEEAKSMLSDLKDRMSFDYDEIYSSFKKELIHIQRNRTWYKELLNKYSQYRIYKSNLTSLINKASTEKIMTDLETISSKIKQRGIRVLEDHLTMLQDKVTTQYVKIINILAMLNNYFLEDLRWDRTARSLDLWQTPTADINTPNILRRTIKKSETWRVWPKSRSMDTMNKTVAGEVEKIVRVYIQKLRDELYLNERTLANIQQLTDEAMNTFLQHLKEYKEDLLIDKHFILQNFVQMDVYYAVLKYENVKQTPAYGVMNFLSEIGGYMGLLIGGSCLTLCEVLDLFLYNFFIEKLRKKLQKQRVEAWPDHQKSEKTPLP